MAGASTSWFNPRRIARTIVPPIVIELMARAKQDATCFDEAANYVGKLPEPWLVLEAVAARTTAFMRLEPTADPRVARLADYERHAHRAMAETRLRRDTRGWYFERAEFLERVLFEAETAIDGEMQGAKRTMHRACRYE